MALLCVASFQAAPADAVFHLVQIDEVMAGASGDTDIQFVEMRMLEPLQNTQPIFTVAITALFLSRLERVTRLVGLGALLVVVGAALVNL